MKYLILLLLLASCASDPVEEKKEKYYPCYCPNGTARQGEIYEYTLEDVPCSDPFLNCNYVPVPKGGK